MGQAIVVAVDLGATSGRVSLVRLDGDRVRAQEVHRFGNQPVHLAGPGGAGLHWDTAALLEQVLAGLRNAQERLAAGERIDSIGIDSWAVDYGLLDGAGDLLGVPYCYRDGRTARGVERVHAVITHEELYPRNGLQFLPFTTLYQLAAEPGQRLAAARTMLLIPDLLAYWLTGSARAEVTNASTTGLLDVRRGTWDLDLARQLGLPEGLLPPLVRPGATIGTLRPPVARVTGLPPSTTVVAVGSHDTASAVVGVPAEDRFAFISCGTWSLVGLELPTPVLTAQARAANFTNEGGVDGTVRFLRNVTGLWLLSECLRTWGTESGQDVDLPELLAAAARIAPGGPVFDADDPALLPPGDMPARIGHAVRAAGGRPPATRPALVRSILDSLAAAYARAVDDAARLTGREVDLIHLVGGGSRNRLLCGLTARATGRPVVAGPAEATTLGNALVQARAAGVVEGDLAALRAVLRRSLPAGTGHRHQP